MRVSCRLTRERELGSDARLPHIELYNLFVINIFEQPQGVRSSSTTLSPPHASRPSPALPRLADPCHPSQHTHDISSHAWLHVIPTVSTLCLRAAGSGHCALLVQHGPPGEVTVDKPHAVGDCRARLRSVVGVLWYFDFGAGFFLRSSGLPRRSSRRSSGYGSTSTRWCAISYGSGAVVRFWRRCCVKPCYLRVVSAEPERCVSVNRVVVAPVDRLNLRDL